MSEVVQGCKDFCDIRQLNRMERAMLGSFFKENSLKRSEPELCRQLTVKQTDHQVLWFLAFNFFNRIKVPDGSRERIFLK